MKFFIVIVLFVISTNILSQIMPDSIIRNEDGVIISKVYLRARGLKYYEYRFYNSKGFYCISLDKGLNGDFYYKNSYSMGVNPDEDVVFLADTFAIGFLNKMDIEDGVDFESKFANTINYYYKSRDYRKDSLLKCYVDSVIKVNNLNIPNLLKEEEKCKQDKRRIDSLFIHYIDSVATIKGLKVKSLLDELWGGKLETESNIVSIETPMLSKGEIFWFEKSILNNVRISKKKRIKLDNKIGFFIETSAGGNIRKIERLNSINGRIDRKIDKNIESLIRKNIRPGPARGGYKLKAGFYLPLN